MTASNSEDLVFKGLKDKAVMKQQIFGHTTELFNLFKEVAAEIAQFYAAKMQEVDSRVSVEYSSNGHYEFSLKFGGDVLVFHMHTNVFLMDRSHWIWKTNYVEKDEDRAYCGMVNIYNFLSDSIKYNRLNDIGYLIARIFINNEGYFFVDGKRQLGFLYNDFGSSKLGRDEIREIIKSSMLYAIEFDLLAPNYNDMKEATVSQILELSMNLKMKTAKRLGFKFESDSDAINYQG